jgi:N-acetylmuramoyl-L-alanine amidase
VKIALGPGHGLYWNENATPPAWYWQRSEWWGIREDTLNAEIIRYVQRALLNQGATVFQLRELNPYAGYGVSGYPKWYEGSREYAKSLGLSASIYDGSNTNYNSDIRARPYMANYYGADILINLHNNGFDGTKTGTETYYDSNNHAGSPALAQYVHTKIINTIRSRYDPGWTNRGVKISDDAYGEINYAQMPAILIELAFMDKQYPDNAYLHDEAFKILAAEAIVGGICDFRGVTCPNISVLPPNLDHHFYLPLIMP